MVRVGIIGSGFGLYGLLPAFNSTENCKVVCICGKKTERLVSYCKSIGLENIYLNWKEMLEKEQLDAVAIAVTPKAQFEIAEYAIKMGLHVFAEKPLAVNKILAKKLYNLAKQKKVVTAVDFIFPEIPEWKKVKDFLDSETYGKLEMISLNWDFQSYDIKHRVKGWKTDVSQGGGALSFYFSHCLYGLENFSGEIKKQKCFLTYSKNSLNAGETGVDMFLEFKNGVLGQAHLSCDAKGENRFKLVFFCEKAKIVLENILSSNVNFEITIFQNSVRKKLFVEKLVKFAGEDERVGLVKSLASRFVECILKKQQCRPSFKAGLRVQGLIDQIRESQI